MRTARTANAATSRIVKSNRLNFIALHSDLLALQANVMIADAGLNITYMNPAVVELLKEAESDLKKELPKFSVASLIGAISMSSTKIRLINETCWRR